MKVAAVSTPNYTPPAVAAGLEEALAALGGMGAALRPGDRVLVKPNMLEGLPPEKAVTTHPVVLNVVLKIHMCHKKIARC